jgi:hypothetical protein
LAYQINTVIVIPAARLPPTLLRTKTEMNLYGMIFKVNMAEYKYFTKLLQSCCRTTKHIAKDIKYIQKALFGRTTTLFLKITCCSISKHIAMTK